MGEGISSSQAGLNIWSRLGNQEPIDRMAVAIEDAGFEIRDMVNWVYGLGFPRKSNYISKAINRMNGMERKKVRITNVRNPKNYGWWKG